MQNDARCRGVFLIEARRMTWLAAVFAGNKY